MVPSKCTLAINFAVCLLGLARSRVLADPRVRAHSQTPVRSDRIVLWRRGLEVGLYALQALFCLVCVCVGVQVCVSCLLVLLSCSVSLRRDLATYSVSVSSFFSLFLTAYTLGGLLDFASCYFVWTSWQ